MQDIDSINCPIHSFETFGAVDGPGIRFVIFTQGCNLQCKYCQNRDTWAHQGGTIYSVKEVLDKIERYKNYIIPSGGGVTVSGGEPLLHIDFLIALFEELKKSFDETFMMIIGTVNKVNKKVDLVTEHYDKVLGSIYKLLYSMCLKERISKKELDNGLFDELPDRLKGGDLNK